MSELEIRAAQISSEMLEEMLTLLIINVKNEEDLVFQVIINELEKRMENNEFIELMGKLLEEV